MYVIVPKKKKYGENRKDFRTTELLCVQICLRDLKKIIKKNKNKKSNQMDEPKLPELNPFFFPVFSWFDLILVWFFEKPKLVNLVLDSENIKMELHQN